MLQFQQLLIPMLFWFDCLPVIGSMLGHTRPDGRDDDGSMIEGRFFPELVRLQWGKRLGWWLCKPPVLILSPVNRSHQLMSYSAEPSTVVSAEFAFFIATSKHRKSPSLLRGPIVSKSQTCKKHPHVDGSHHTVHRCLIVSKQEGECGGSSPSMSQ